MPSASLETSLTQISLYAGMVRGRKMLKTKKGDMMCFVELEDKFGTLEIVVFPSVFQTMGGLIKDRALLHVKGKISCKEEEEPKILADMLEPVDRFCSLQLQRDPDHSCIVYFRPISETFISHSALVCTGFYELCRGDAPCG